MLINQRHKIKIDIPTDSKPNEVIHERVGKLTFSEPGVYTFTVRPTLWQIRTDKNVIGIKSIELREID